VKTSIARFVRSVKCQYQEDCQLKAGWNSAGSEAAIAVVLASAQLGSREGCRVTHTNPFHEDLYSCLVVLIFDRTIKQT